MAEEAEQVRSQSEALSSNTGTAKDQQQMKHQKC
jgi:hypothetical protein